MERVKKLIVLSGPKRRHQLSGPKHYYRKFVKTAHREPEVVEEGKGDAVSYVDGKFKG